MIRHLGTALRVAATASVLSRVVRVASASPAIAEAHGEQATGGISIVIPARNEAKRLAPAIDAIIAAPDVTEVIVVDDGSTDETAAVAEAAGARVIRVDALLHGERLAGPTRRQGVEAASGEWVLVLDADTRARSTLPRALVARARADRLALLTIAGRFESATPWAQWLHASMLTTLVYRFGPPGGSALLANGQCMIVRREEFLGWGGFAPVAGSVVEDVALARWLSDTGRSVGFLDGGSLLAVEPYPTFAATWAGWSRSLGLPGADSRRRRAVDAAMLALTMPMPAIRLVTGRADVVDLVAIALRVGTVFGTARAYRRPTLAHWASPLADVLAVGALVVSLGARHQVWRGRRYAI